MRARLITVGERMPAWVADGYAEYAKRLSRELPLDLVELKLGDRGKNRDLVRALNDEGAAMLAAIPKNALVVALDGRGAAWSSQKLADEMAAWRMLGRDVALLIGGPDGLAPAAFERADARWSLGPLTLPHMLVRLIVAEQLYRAVSLLANHPYHRA